MAERDYLDFEDGYFDDEDYDPRPIYRAGELEAMTPDRLMDEMDRACNSQADCVDNFGRDDASYRAERRCDHVEAELKRRGLEDAYWKRADSGGPDHASGYGRLG